MIAEHFDDLEAVTSTKHACALLGASRATRYRRRRAPIAGPPVPRPSPPNALGDWFAGLIQPPRSALMSGLACRAKRKDAWLVMLAPNRGSEEG